MADRKKLVAGNWKMNGLRSDGLTLATELARRVRAATGAEQLSCDLLICPPATLLGPVHDAIVGSGIHLGGQDCHPAPKGAFTGDISAEMLADAGCRFVILGHSERRQGHGESDALVREKIGAARRAGLVPIVCVGETLAQRQAREAAAVVVAQLAGSLPERAAGRELIVAYEPVWAIGTGLSASLDDIVAMHAVIRRHLPTEAHILYGGSVNPANAGAILALGDVDGALVGGASLAADSFWAIASSCG
ncbi:MAG: triose-phosphate isomerase [Alphaproteobacteria bacterium]|nr:triose-phosphate isomerase [Alphaproteobacteria bacterium]